MASVAVLDPTASEVDMDGEPWAFHIPFCSVYERDAIVLLVSLTSSWQPPPAFAPWYRGRGDDSDSDDYTDDSGDSSSDDSSDDE